MTTTELRNIPGKSTSALGSMRPARVPDTFQTVLIAIPCLTTAIVNTYGQGSNTMWKVPVLHIGRTAADPVGRFDFLREPAESTARSVSLRLAKSRHVPLSCDASDARRPPMPSLLLGAKQDRLDIPAKARTVRAKRMPTVPD